MEIILKQDVNNLGYADDLVKDVLQETVYRLIACAIDDAGVLTANAG